MEKRRLAKVMASAGIASRRACESIIAEGRVKVNGEVTLLPQTLVNLIEDRVEIDGHSVQEEQTKLYFLLNKPEGYVCSNASRNHKLVIDLFAEHKTRLFTVGRLDKDTTGLLLVTNDGLFANRAIHPRARIQREYVAKTNPDIGHEHLKLLSRGAKIEGHWIRPVRVTKVRANTVKIVVMEGKKREVRILLQSVGLEVLTLTRVRLGNLHLGKLPLGAYKRLTLEECERVFG